MDWINIYGFVFMLFIMITNIIFTLKNKDGFQNLWNNKIIEVFEQIGRFGCFGFMILIVAYCLIWFICFKKNSIFRALALSIIPSVIFLTSGSLSRYILLIVTAIIFAPCHVIISYKNAVLETK